MATDTLEPAIDATGAVTYSGNPPHVTRSISGTGSIEPA
jgi:hypothetical protein